MKNLIIIGARGFGREVHSFAMECTGYKSDYTIKGFVDDKVDALDGFNDYAPVLCSVEAYEIEPDDVFICGLGSPIHKRKYVDIIAAKGGEFINLIHPSVTFAQNVQLGKGLIIGKDCVISNDVTIKDYVTMHPFCVIGHDAILGECAFVGAFCFMAGYSVLEEQVSMNVRSSILANITVGTCAIVGASSLAAKDVKEGTTVFGTPARVIPGYNTTVETNKMQSGEL
ncbi:MAG TPA: sialic acid O-acetyltransferase [Flavobacterium sp.]|jgi:sugar O-acyltransferase (sialic acid O-acetyltransferase NeuD family)